ncbi:ABC transporter permease [Nocardioides terrisoli]|uniref:ABC transporter permease n=1 Tax=Nocardioides terrisoli TaxID=3388267 RepID=UPI00287BA186|nr:ABC transporter permease [Nocardioides marmorisolisilvae]
MKHTSENGRRAQYTLRTRTRRYLLSDPILQLERAGLGIALAVMFTAFGMSGTGDLFLSSANLDNVLVSGSVVGIVALAMLPPLVAGHFDLSVAAVACVSNIIAASLIGKYGLPVLLGVLLGALAGAVLGVLTGYLVAKLKLNAFVVTFGVYILLNGLTTLYTHGAQIVAGIPPSLGAWSGKSFLGVPRPFVALIVVAAVLWYALLHVPWGRKLEAIGSNESAARLVGINVDRSVWYAFVVSGLLSGVAGSLLTSILGAGDPTAALSYLFPAFAAVFLGATTIRPGRYNVIGTVIGVYFVGTAVSGLSLLGADTWVQPTFNGGALIVAVGLSTYLAQVRQRRQTRTSAATASSATPSSEGTVHGITTS